MAYVRLEVVEAVIARKWDVLSDNYLKEFKAQQPEGYHIYFPNKPTAKYTYQDGKAHGSQQMVRVYSENGQMGFNLTEVPYCCGILLLCNLSIAYLGNLPAKLTLDLALEMAKSLNYTRMMVNTAAGQDVFRDEIRKREIAIIEESFVNKRTRNKINTFLLKTGVE